MPIWLWIHGILLIIWIIIWGSFYYLKLWTLSFPFNKMTSIKIIISLFLPLSWLLTSLIIGIILSFLSNLNPNDTLFLIFIPLLLLLVLMFHYILSSFQYNKRENQIQFNLINIKDSCQKWIKQFPFIKEEKYDIQVFVSKNKVVGKVIIYELTCNEQKCLKEKSNNLPQGVTLLFTRK